MNSPSARRRKAEQLYQCNPQFKIFVDKAVALRSEHQFTDVDLMDGVKLAVEMAARKSGARPATAAWGVEILRPEDLKS